MATTQEKWQEISNRGLQDNFDAPTRAKFDEAVNRGLITIPEQSPSQAQSTIPDTRVQGSQVDQYKSLLLQQAKGVQGLEGQISSLYTDLQSQQQARPQREIPQAEPSNDVGFVQDIFTGENRMTPKLEGLPDLGSAPELNEMSVRAFKSALGAMTTGDEKELTAIMKKQYGNEVDFTKDEKGNVIVKFPSGEYPLNKPGFSPQDIPKTVADMTLFGRAAKAKTITGAVTANAAVQGAIEAVSERLGGTFDENKVMMAGLLGGGLKGLENAIGTIYRSAKGAMTGESAKLLDEAVEAGIPIKTSDVLPPQTFPGKIAQQTGEKVPFVGTAGTRETQQEFRQEAVDELAKKYDSFSYDAIINSLKDKKNTVMKAAGNTLEKAGNKLDEAGEIATEHTLRSIDDATAELTKPGVISSAKGLDDLSQLITALKEPQTYTTLKENRTAFRDIVDQLDPAARSQLTSRAKALLGKVEKGMTVDMMAFAKNNLPANEFRQLKNANKVWAQESSKLKNTKLKTILDKGDFTPERVKGMLFSKNKSEIESLYGSLTSEGRANSRAAIISEIAKNSAKRKDGFTPNAFSSEIKKYDEQVKVFFKGEERRKLNGLRSVLESTARAQEAAITTPTGQSLIGGMTGYAAFTDLGATAGLLGTVGGLARLYESPSVRNALLKLGGTPKGSTGFEKALLSAQQAINAAAQTLQNE